MKSWPPKGLEQVNHCPICGSEDRSLLHGDLFDRVFDVAPGRWALWRCAICNSAYLNPRPTPATIHLAYESYYTHEEEAADQPKGIVSTLRNAIGNAYRNRRFGTRLSPRLPLLSWIARLFPHTRKQIDLQFRYLPSPAEGRGRVLDVGCGNGEFLRLAAKAGWKTAGVEPDPRARTVASQGGNDVRPTLQDWEGEKFDYVTINHVIEHLHDPVTALKCLHDLLKPGGRLFLDTPNIDARGHQIFGEFWRDLDPPRHLALFNYKSLTDALVDAGFRIRQVISRPEMFPVIAEQSARMALGIPPFSNVAVSLPPVTSPEKRVAEGVTDDEFLTLIATRV